MILQKIAGEIAPPRGFSPQAGQMAFRKRGTEDFYEPVKLTFPFQGDKMIKEIRA